MYADSIFSCISICKFNIQYKIKIKIKKENMEMFKYLLFSLLRAVVFLLLCLFHCLSLGSLWIAVPWSQQLSMKLTISTLLKKQSIYWLTLWIPATFLIKPFFCTTKKSGQKCKYLKKEKSFYLYSGWPFLGLLRDGGKKQPLPIIYNLSHTPYNDETWHSYTLPKEDSKII